MCAELPDHLVEYRTRKREKKRDRRVKWSPCNTRESRNKIYECSGCRVEVPQKSSWVTSQCGWTSARVKKIVIENRTRVKLFVVILLNVSPSREFSFYIYFIYFSLFFLLDYIIYFYQLSFHRKFFNTKLWMTRFNLLLVISGIIMSPRNNNEILVGRIINLYIINGYRYNNKFK